MSQTYHEYFKENKVKIFLKYDGKRKTKMYTIMLIDKQNADDTLMQNTDEPFNVYSEFTNKKDIIVSDGSVFQFFMSSIDKLCSIFGNEIVFILTMELRDEVEFYTSVELTNNSYTCTKPDLASIKQFLNTL